VVDAVVVEDITGWDAELRALTEGVGWLFGRPEPRVVLADFVRGLLADVPKKNSWGLAEHAGYATPRPFEHLLDGAVWDVDALRDAVRAYVVEHLGSPDAAVVLDDTQALKKGTKSVGVAPQYYGLTGDTANVQTVVMLTYASSGGHAFIDRELYLPHVWTEDPARCRAAGVPKTRGFMTKPELARVMLERVLAAGVPFRWVLDDAGYGRDPGLRAFCHQRALSYVMAVPVDLPLVGLRGRALRPDVVLASTRDRQWERRSCGPGAKGNRYYDWAAHTVTVKGQAPAPGYEHTLLIRRTLHPTVTTAHPDGVLDVDYFLAHAPVGTPIPQMITAAGLRWSVEDDNKTGKDLLGLDQYQVRKWTPFYRHITLCMLAHAFLAVIRADLGKDPQPRETGAELPSPHS
jgi:SRSO17 transposase